jgi:hypothetical protein
MTDPQPSAVERAIAYGIDISLLIENLRLTPTERVRRGEAFARFAWSVREQGRLARESQREHAANTDREDPDPPAR